MISHSMFPKWMFTLLLLVALGLASFVYHSSSEGKEKKKEDHREAKKTSEKEKSSKILYKGEEKYLSNIKQLTFEGKNAEAYFSPDGKEIIFQSVRGDLKCDQIFIMNLDGSNKRMVSTGKGKCTCAYFLKNGNIIYASTHLKSPKCPPKPDRSQGYVWPMYPGFDIFVANRKGKVLKRLTKNPYYDAEATLSPDGKTIVFTSKRDGDIDIYTMNTDGTNLKRLTTAYGYDGGPFFSPDGTKICYRSYHPETEEEKKRYKKLLEKNLIRPSRVDLFIMDADGSNKKQLTDDDKAHFAPFFTPDGKKLIFCSNAAGGHSYDLYLIGIDGKGMERVTYSGGFTSFPMFSPDGKKLIFCSNRGSKSRRQFNIFIADWKDQ